MSAELHAAADAARAALQAFFAVATPLVTWSNKKVELVADAAGAAAMLERWVDYIPGAVEESTRAHTGYIARMAEGAAAYADVLDALKAVGYEAFFTQTGGMCAASEIKLGADRYVYVTDAEDSLSWERDEHEGWAVGLYLHPSGDFVRGDDTPDGDVESLLALLAAVLT